MKAIAAAAVAVMLAGTASAQTLDDLKNDGKNPDNVLTYGMGYSLNRYSPLKQIDKAMVKRLVPTGI
jgi:alcohol dehydrogenase (cytochrome c)